VSDEPRPLLSIVSPVFDAASIVPELVHRIRCSVAALGSFEIVLVDDRSRDLSWGSILAMSEQFPEVKGVRLSRNFGQQAAIAAGLAAARGRYVVVMDCDLQDDPSHIPEMIELAYAGADIVLTHRSTRRHSGFRNLSASVYTRIIAALSGQAMASPGQGSFSLLSRKVVDAYIRFGDVHAHYLATLRYLGFNQQTLEVEHAERFDGSSSYTFPKLFRLAVDGIVSQSLRLLHVAVSIGFGFFILSILGAIYLIASYLVRGALPGFTSLMVMILLTSGCILMSIGVVGVYLGRVFEQVKGRPRFVVDQAVGWLEEKPE
jgi:dolichol-phosphate mannosyltransferase